MERNQCRTISSAKSCDLLPSTAAIISVPVVPRIKSIMRPTNASAAMMIIAKLLSRTAIPSNAYIIDGGCEEIVTKL